ncbi:hypothetical protein FXO38_10116 [Capsicum annuum]|nr:hypothetical protein FXO38_10116 [Capsicum annuum]
MKNKTGREQEKQERRPSSNPNRLESAIVLRPSVNTTSHENGTRVMVKRSHDALGESSHPPSAGGGTIHKRTVGMTFSPLGRVTVSYPNSAFPILDAAQLTVYLPMDLPHPCPSVASTKDRFNDSIQPLQGQPEVVFKDNAKEQEAQGVEEPAAVFDPTRLTVDLPMDQPRPYSSPVCNKDGSDNLHGEVVEDNAEELAAQGVEAAAKPRPDMQPCGTTYTPFGQMICSYTDPESPTLDPVRPNLWYKTPWHEKSMRQYFEYTVLNLMELAEFRTVS